MKRYGYHRTSTREQHLDRGIAEITAYCESNNLSLEKIYTDQQTGKNFNRPRYTILKEDVLRSGDELIITEVDRLGCNKADARNSRHQEEIDLSEIKPDVEVRVTGSRALKNKARGSAEVKKNTVSKVKGASKDSYKKRAVSKKGKFKTKAGGGAKEAIRNIIMIRRTGIPFTKPSIEPEIIEDEPEEEPVKEEKSRDSRVKSNPASMFILIVIACIGAVAYHLLKNKKRREDLEEAEEMDSYDIPDDENDNGTVDYHVGSALEILGEYFDCKVTAIVPAISDISASPMMGFFKPEEEVKAAKEAYDKGEGELMYLNFMPRAFDEGAAYYYSARGTHPRWSNQVVAWSQLELVKYNVTNIMKEMQKPYCVITAENAWSKPSSEEIFNAVPTDTKEMHVIPEASHFDMYDLAPFVSEAFEYIIPFFGKNL